MLFSQITGYEDIKRALVHSVQKGHIAHAQLLLGKEGTPNLPLALAYATYVNCLDKQPADSCGKCSSCSKYERLVHPDLHFIFPSATLKDVAKDSQTNELTKRFRSFIIENPYRNLQDWSSYFGAENKQPNIGVEESRGIVKTLSLKAFEAEYKVLLIWLPEYMNIQAANALLKILEEPPAKTLFLLVSNSADKLLATIISRTQIIQVRPFEDQEMESYLVTNGLAAPEKANQIARLADGDLNQAIKLIKEIKNDYHALFAEWMRLCYGKRVLDLIQKTDQFQQLGREGQKSFFQYGLSMFRDALMIKLDGEQLVRVRGEEFDFIKKFSGVLTTGSIEMIAQQLGDASAHIERNANPKIVFLDTSLLIIKILHQMSATPAS
jgi:DNA polymerase III subunit delta'